MVHPLGLLWGRVPSCWRVPIGVLIAAKMIPREVFQECKEKAREVAEGEKPVSRVAAVIVVAVWLLFVALSVFLALRVF
jgi:predicted nucleic acid-binding Zn ribbon protein